MNKIYIYIYDIYIYTVYIETNIWEQISNPSIDLHFTDPTHIYIYIRHSFWHQQTSNISTALIVIESIGI